WLDGGGDPRALIAAARRLVFLKGRDAHDYKFSSAALEDYDHVGPEWRDRCLASSLALLRHAGERDNGLVTRTRAALGRGSPLPRGRLRDTSRSRSESESRGLRHQGRAQRPAEATREGRPPGACVLGMKWNVSYRGSPCPAPRGPTGEEERQATKERFLGTGERLVRSRSRRSLLPRLGESTVVAEICARLPA